MTTKEAYRHFLLKIQSIYELPEATVITDRLFEKIASVVKADLIKYPADPLLDKDLDTLDQAVAQLLLHRPIQYVLGECWFHKLRFKVHEAVLIPRPETEEMVEEVIREFKDQAPNQIKSLHILDIGTGSGCIAISLKKELSFATVTGIDISEKALTLARDNARSLEAEIQFLKMDILDESNWALLPAFDIIISNPPYIPSSEKDELDKHITLFEPSEALFVPDKDPLIFYKKIARFGIQHLKSKGKIYLETHSCYAKQVVEEFTCFYPEIVLKKDISGHDRMVIASY